MSFEITDRDSAIDDAANLHSIPDIPARLIANEYRIWDEWLMATNDPLLQEYINVVHPLLKYSAMCKIFIAEGGLPESERAEYQARIGAHYAFARFAGRLLLGGEGAPPRAGYLHDHIAVPMSGFPMEEGALSVVSTALTTLDPPFGDGRRPIHPMPEEQWWSDAEEGLHVLVRPIKISENEEAFLKQVWPEKTVDLLLGSGAGIQMFPYNSLDWLASQSTS